jgi:tRNA(fMet)-specific endonuclease VapC
MKFLLDANAVIGLLAGQARLLRNVRRRRPDDVGLSVIATHELYFGAFRSTRTTINLDRIDALQFELVLFDRNDARVAGAIRAELAARGTPIGAYDVLIAAQARSRDLTLVTHNVSEFSRVPGLRWEDWER